MKNATGRLATLTVCLLALLPAATPAAGDTGRCFRADVPFTMLLPDGSEYGPGSLRVCLDSELNPVAGLHRTSVDNRTIGVFQSRVANGRAELEADGTTFVFFENPSGLLVLEGYEIALDGEVTTYRMAPRVTSQWKLASGRASSGQDRDGLVLIGASR